MKVNLNGFEAIEDGIYAGGIEEFLCEVVSEPLCNAEKAICKGSFFASSGRRTACVITEKDVNTLWYLNKMKSSIKTGIEIIILGRYPDAELLKTLESFSIPLFSAEYVNDIRMMTADATKYSELRRSPVAVFIPVRLLRSRQPVMIDGRCYCDNLWDSDYYERKERTMQIEKKYNRVTEFNQKTDINSRCLVICMSGCSGQVIETAGCLRNVSICKLDLIGGVMPPLADINGDGGPAQGAGEQYKRTVIIGHGSGCINRTFREKNVISGSSIAAELKGDPLHEISEISSILKNMLPAVNAGQIGKMYGPDKTPRIIKPSMHTYDGQMCPGCPYRERVRELVKSHKAVSVYEDIYCEKRGTIVLSGEAHAKSAYDCDIVISNRKENALAGFNVCYIDAVSESECRKIMEDRNPRGLLM